GRVHDLTASADADAAVAPRRAERVVTTSERAAEAPPGRTAVGRVAGLAVVAGIVRPVGIGGPVDDAAVEALSSVAGAVGARMTAGAAVVVVVAEVGAALGPRSRTAAARLAHGARAAGADPLMARFSARTGVGIIAGGAVEVGPGSALTGCGIAVLD